MARYAPFTTQRRAAPEPDLGALPASMAKKCPKCAGVDADCDLCTSVLKLLGILKIGGVVISSEKSVSDHIKLIGRLLDMVHSKYTQLTDKRKAPVETVADTDGVVSETETLTLPPECFVPQTYTTGDDRLNHATRQMESRIAAIHSSVAKETAHLRQQVDVLTSRVSKRKRASSSSLSAAAASAASSSSARPASSVRNRVVVMVQCCVFNLTQTKNACGMVGWRYKSCLDEILKSRAVGDTKATEAGLSRLLFESGDTKTVADSESINNRLLFGLAVYLFRVTTTGGSWTVHFHGKYSVARLREACDVGQIMNLAPNFLFLSKGYVSLEEIVSCASSVMVELESARRADAERFKQIWVAPLDHVPVSFSKQ